MLWQNAQNSVVDVGTCHDISGIQNLLMKRGHHIGNILRNICSKLL